MQPIQYGYEEAQARERSPRSQGEDEAAEAGGAQQGLCSKDSSQQHSFTINIRNFAYKAG